MKGLRYWIICMGLMLPPVVWAQLPSNRVRPAEMYYAGDTVRSMRLGLTTRIPDGWSGVLPRDTEVFLLMPQNNTIGEIYVVVNENIDLEKQIARWKTGMELAPGLVLQPKGDITKRGADVISAMGAMVGNNANNQSKAYAEAKCSPVGFCVTYLAIADPSTFEGVKKALQSFVDNTIFEQPSNESPYANFNWKRFLAGKTLISMQYESNSKRFDEVDLCADGTFLSKIKRTGIFKSLAEGYQGSKEGTWEVKSNGPKATIKFTFEKLDPVEIELEGKDEEIYIKGNRYFVGESDRCKK